MHRVIGSNPGENNFFFYAAAMLFLLYEELVKFCIFLNTITIHHCMALLSIPLQKSVLPPIV